MRLSEIEKTLPMLIKNNEELTKLNQSKITYNIEGVAGIGKTEVIEQIANDLGYRFVKVNLAQTEETGDILGLPVKEYKCIINDKAMWINDKVLESAIKSGAKLTSEFRMGYAAPAWVPKDHTPTIIVFDDYNRATPIIMQAVMEIISRNEYISWKLPKETQLFLTSNPEDGEYNVYVQDGAQRSRFITLRAEFDVEDWAKWAENNNLKGELINFALTYREIFDKPEINARNYTMFCKSIQSLDLTKDYILIETLANGAFSYDKKDTYISDMLQAFIRNNMHNLITPKDMLELPWDKCKDAMVNSIYVNGEHRIDISSLLTMRFCNYVARYFKESADKNKSTKVNERIIEFIESDITLISEDMIFVLIKELIANFKQRCAKLLSNPKIVSKLL